MITNVRQDLEQLKDRYARITEFVVPRTTLSDGSLGYLMTARTEMLVRVGPDPMSPEAVEENLVFDIRNCEVKVPDPTYTADGDLRYDIEVWKIEGSTVAQHLFGEPTEVTMRVGRGIDPLMRQTLGRAQIGSDVDFGPESVMATQWVNLEIDTPFGTLRNSDPAEMRAPITQLPPVGSAFEQQGVVGLYTDHGVLVGAKANTMSTLTGFE